MNLQRWLLLVVSLLQQRATNNQKHRKNISFDFVFCRNSRPFASRHSHKNLQMHHVQRSKCSHVDSTTAVFHSKRVRRQEEPLYVRTYVRKGRQNRVRRRNFDTIIHHTLPLGVTFFSQNNSLTTSQRHEA